MTSVEYMRYCIYRIYGSDRFFSYDSIKKTCSIVEDLMRDLGMEQVKTDWFPSDGKTDFGGWLMPLCWNPKHAVLNIVSPDGSEKELCSYEKIPCSLMLYSRSADVIANVVMPDAEDFSGKIVFVSDHQLQMKETMSFMARGAVGVVCSHLKSPWFGKTGFEHLNNACQWCNYQIPFWPVQGDPFGFSLTPNQGVLLQGLMQKEGKVVFHAKLDVEMTEGMIPVVSGLLPGETDEEIVLDGHLFEEGANDNASGVAEALAIVRELSSVRRKRGIRLIFTHESKSLQAYMNTEKVFPKMVAGLNIDMVGSFLDRVASIGDGAPSCPTFATPFIKFLLEKYGCSVRICSITGNDASFCEPFFGTSILTLDCMAYPNYHNSADTPEQINPKDLNAIFSAAKEYTETLVNAGLPEAKMLAKLSQKYDMERKTAGRIANQRLHTVKNLVCRTDEREELEKFLHALQFEETLETVTEKSELLRNIFPVKQFRGFFSFEKFWAHADKQYPELASLFTGWSAQVWVDHAMIWADGTRSAELIWNLVNRYFKKKITAEFFLKFLQFMKKHGYLNP